MRSVLAPAPHPEPTIRLSSVTSEDSFLRNDTEECVIIYRFFLPYNKLGNLFFCYPTQFEE